MAHLDWIKERFLAHRGNAYVVCQKLEREQWIRASLRTAQRVHDDATAAHLEALRMFKPYSRLADHDGGFEVEASLDLGGPSVAVSKTLHAPAWLQIWWNDQTPFGGLRKTFRRMWMAKESYQNLEKQVHDIWARS